VVASVPRLEDPPGAAFLLAALGAHAAARFTERIAALDLTPAQTGLLRAIAADPGQSQQSMAQLLGTPPSRLVGLVDSVADRGLVERRRNPDDRRLHALYLTEDGEALMDRISTVGQEHDESILRSLDAGDQARLRALLLRVAEDQGLTPGVHPGFRHI
jgi:DNA-binding MarR family transcriptional regulator